LQRIHLSHGILERDGRVLLVASRYRNHAHPLWNLPGGRQREGETLDQTVRREFLEEAQLFVEINGLRYVSESTDSATDTQFTSFVFSISSSGTPRMSTGDAHVVGIEWVTIDKLRERLTVRVVREPLIAHLVDSRQRYFPFAEAGISIEFSDEP
jgi:ADP-ribose pyrophosphatase YjhB (NUDIX family)